MQTFQQDFKIALTHLDMKRNLTYPVDVPPGTHSLHVRLHYAPLEVEQIHNLLTLTILGPDGFRGAGHRHSGSQEVVLQEDGASPGFVPGPVTSGRWIVLVDTHMIMPGAPLQMDLTISGSDQPDASLPSAPIFPPPTARPARGPGWYRGDFHTHTIHSDGSWDVPDLLAFARANQLDFLTLSDHNTISGLTQFESASPPDLLPICGMELTTFWGHALALGRRHWVDWRITPGQREMAQIAAEIEAQGGLFVIAHPEAIGDPYCTGCNWRYADMRPGSARVVEVWNSPWDSESYNEAGLKLAYEWMQRGLRMVLTAGTDRHGLPLAAPECGFNVVYTHELSETAILQAVRAGHLYLSSGPSLAFNMTYGGQTWMIGDSCHIPAGEAAQFHASWADCPPGARLELVVDGNVQMIFDSARPSAEWELPGGAVRWALLTMQSASGEMLALTNPIYLDGR